MFEKFKQWFKREVEKSRPIKPMAKSLPGQVYKPITEKELSELVQKGVITLDYAQKMLDEHSLSGTPFELDGGWYQIVGSHH